MAFLRWPSRRCGRTSLRFLTAASLCAVGSLAGPVAAEEPVWDVGGQCWRPAAAASCGGQWDVARRGFVGLEAASRADGGAETEPARPTEPAPSPDELNVEKAMQDLDRLRQVGDAATALSDILQSVAPAGALPDIHGGSAQ